MRVTESILNWRLYLRNRLHRVLERAGWERLRKYGVIEGKKRRPIDLVLELEHVNRSLCCSIMQYAAVISDVGKYVENTQKNVLHSDMSSRDFCEVMFYNHQMITGFIRTLSETDLQLVLNPPVFNNNVSVQWLLEFSNFHEQSITEKTMQLLRQQDPSFYVPWSTNQYMKPLKPPKL
jgi:hypothetical protein